MTSILDKYPMGTLRQATMSMWLASRHFTEGKITEVEFGELRAYLHDRMARLEQEGRTASARALKQSLMMTTARLTNRTESKKMSMPPLASPRRHPLS
jgi:hypothetical protein